MTLADDIRKAVEGWEPRCSECEQPDRGQRGWHKPATDCECPWPEDHHPFTYDPALDRSPEALLVRALRVVEAAEAALVHLDHEHPGWAAQTLRAALGGDR